MKNVYLLAKESFFLGFVCYKVNKFILLNRFANDSQSLEQHRHVECKHKVESQQATFADAEGQPVEDGRRL
jgi:hypothetical protein